ncbi:MAG TPA: porin [Polyangiaceae bacterium]
MRRSPLLPALLSCVTCVSFVPSLARAQNARPAPKKADEATKAPLPPEILPPPPPPWTSPSGTPPTSTSGATLLPAGSTMTTQAAGPAAPTATPTPFVIPSQDLETRLRAIEARLAADENTLVNMPELSWIRRFHMSGYLQPQILIQAYNDASSPNLFSGSLPPNVGANDVIAKSNGTSTNGTFFRLRRARLRTEFAPSEGTKFVFEIDPTPAGGAIGGTGTIARTVEAQGIAHWTDYLTTEFAAGIFKIPLGFEVLQSDADRPFIERSWGEQNLTPGEFDTGARAYTTWKKNGRWVALQLAIVNGQTEGESTFSAIPDLNRGKDFVGRLAFDYGDWFEIGASGYYGSGQNIDPTNLRFKQFERWAANGELELYHTFSPSLGATKVFGEVTFAQNLDRGVKYTTGLPAIPTPITTSVGNLSERNLWVRVEQDLSQWATLGFRWDEYTPDTSISDNARDTFAVVGVAHFNAWLQLMLEYDHAIDHVHAAGKSATDKQYEIGSGVLQARF